MFYKSDSSCPQHPAPKLAKSNFRARLIRTDIMFMGGVSRFSTSTDDLNVPAAPEPAPSDPLDDVFGEDSNDDRAPRNQLSNPSAASYSRTNDVSDVPRLQGIHTTNGYRDGIAASKEKFLQEGFDEGYSLGAEIGAAAGRLIGVLEALVVAIREEADEGIAEKLAGARTELSAKSLYAPEYFGEDGIWKYNVAGAEDDEDNVTFRVVVRNHPLISKWTGAVDVLLLKYGLRSKSL